MGTNAFRIGLTGGIASGKSTVGRLLTEAGFQVIDADELVAELYRPDGAGAEVVRELFGEEYLDAEGAVDHAALARLVFARPETRAELERAIHPRVRERFAQLVTAAEEPIVLEATLLVEAGYAPDFDLVVSVEADDKTRLSRAVARGASHDDVYARLVAQGGGEERRAAAHVIVRNDGDLDELCSRIDELVEEIRSLAAKRRASAESK